MNTPKKQPVRVTTKKYTRDELATKVATLTEECEGLKIGYRGVMEKNHIAWQRQRTLVETQERLERRVWDLNDENFLLKKELKADRALLEAEIAAHKIQRSIRRVLTVAVIALSVLLMICR